MTAYDKYITTNPFESDSNWEKFVDSIYNQMDDQTISRMEQTNFFGTEQENEWLLKCSDNGYSIEESAVFIRRMFSKQNEKRN